MKMKTHKAMSKRVVVTKGGKVLKRVAGQDHFNSRESGNTTRNKRRDKIAMPGFKKSLRGLMPYAHIA